MHRKRLNHPRPALGIEQAVQVKARLPQDRKICQMLMGKSSQKRRHSHSAGSVGSHRRSSARDSFFPYHIRQEKTEQDQRADQDKIWLDPRGKKPCRSPAGRCMRRPHPFPLQSQVQAEQDQPLRPQRHIHRHLGQHDGRKDEKQAAHRRFRPFPHIMVDEKGSERSLQHKTNKAPQPEILEPLRQDSPEQLEEHSQKRHRIRIDHRHLIRPGHPVRQPDGKGPCAVPEKAPPKIMLGQVSAAQQPVRIGNIQHMHAVNTQKSRDPDCHAAQPDHIIYHPGRKALSVPLPHRFCFSFHSVIRRPPGKAAQPQAGSRPQPEN